MWGHGWRVWGVVRNECGDAVGVCGVWCVKYVGKRMACGVWCVTNVGTRLACVGCDA